LFVGIFQLILPSPIQPPHPSLFLNLPDSGGEKPTLGTEEGMKSATAFAYGPWRKVVELPPLPPFPHNNLVLGFVFCPFCLLKRRALAMAMLVNLPQALSTTSGLSFAPLSSWRLVLLAADSLCLNACDNVLSCDWRRRFLHCWVPLLCLFYFLNPYPLGSVLGVGCKVSLY